MTGVIGPETPLVLPARTVPDRSYPATLPPETAYCHTCGFTHTRRPDWLCPRCGIPAGTEPPPRRPVAASPEEPSSRRAAS